VIKPQKIDKILNCTEKFKEFKYLDTLETLRFYSQNCVYSFSSEDCHQCVIKCYNIYTKHLDYLPRPIFNYSKTPAIHLVENRFIWLIGGGERQNKIEYFDLLKNKWIVGPESLYISFPYSSVDIGSKIYVFGRWGSYGVLDTNNIANGWTEKVFRRNLGYYPPIAININNDILLIYSPELNAIYSISNDHWRLLHWTTPIISPSFGQFDQTTNTLTLIKTDYAYSCKILDKNFDTISKWQRFNIPMITNTSSKNQNYK
jgi:hypothetical protein